jgi:hypothetical protein
VNARPKGLPIISRKKGAIKQYKESRQKNYSISAVNDPVWVKPLNLKVKITRYTEQARVN